MPPRVRFASSPLGRIAYVREGSGPPLICDTGWISHIERMWAFPSYRAFVSGLTERHSVIIFDRPGCGMSERRRDDYSLASEVATVTALLEAAGGRASLLGCSIGAHVAATVACEQPDAVERLVLFGGSPRGEELAPAAVRAALPDLIRSSWGLGSRAFADIFMPSEPRESLQWYATVQREACEPDVAVQMLEAFYAVDVRDRLADVDVPTLVLHRRGDRAVPKRAGVMFAEGIPGAELVLLDGDAHPPYMGDADAVVAATLSFLNPEEVDDPLTEREREVAILVSEGLTNAEIAERLTISPRTVDSHIDRIRSKLDVRSRAQIATWITANR